MTDDIGSILRDNGFQMYADNGAVQTYYHPDSETAIEVQGRKIAIGDGTLSLVVGEVRPDSDVETVVGDALLEWEGAPIRARIDETCGMLLSPVDALRHILPAWNALPSDLARFHALAPIHKDDAPFPETTSEAVVRAVTNIRLGKLPINIPSAGERRRSTNRLTSPLSIWKVGEVKLG